MKSLKGIFLLIIFLLFVSILSLRLGSASLSLEAFWSGLLCKKDFTTETIILYNIRIPRILGAIVAGAGLSVSGVLLQNTTGNDLAGPNIIGVNAGAGFAMIVFLCFFSTAFHLFPVVSFLGAFVTTILIVTISSRINHSNTTVVLTGVAFTAMLNAGISFLSLLFPDVLVSYNYFSVGGLSGVLLDELLIPAIMIVTCIGISIFLARQLDILYLGDSLSISLGVNATLLRIVSLILASGCAAAVVSFAGLLGFVGLVVPHIGRKLVGQSMKYLIPVSAFVGAILVLIADLVGRTLFAPTEIPVGIVMALIGAPFFFWLLIRQRKG